MSWGKPPDAAGMDAERTVRLFRVACATALRHLDGVAKFGDALVALETAERRLAEFSVAEVRALASGASPDARRVAAALVSLRDATDRASKKLDNWLAASKTKRMMGYDGNVRAALNELAVRAVDVADAAREHADDARESPDKLPDKLPDELPDELPNPLEVLAGTAFDDREAELEPKPNLPPAARRADGTPRFADSSPQSAAATPPFPLSLAELSLATDAPLSIPNAAADAKYTAALRAVAEGNARFGVECMCEAADAGHAAAAAQAAPALAEGRGCVRDVKRAARYYRVAAEAGDARALNEYGTMLLDGDEEATGVAQNLEAAARCFAAAGGRGSAAGDYNLAACHERGAGVPRDVEKAVELYSRALSLGVFRAHLALGYLATARGRSPAAADHFGAVLAANAAGDIEKVGLTAKDAADATFAMACVYERAAAIGRRRADDAESTSAAVAAVGRLRTVGGTRGESEETARAAARAPPPRSTPRDPRRDRRRVRTSFAGMPSRRRRRHARSSLAPPRWAMRARRCAWARVSGPTRNASRRRRRAMRKRPHARRRFGGSFAPPRMGSGRRGRGSGTSRGTGGAAGRRTRGLPDGYTPRRRRWRTRRAPRGWRRWKRESGRRRRSEENSICFPRRRRWRGDPTCSRGRVGESRR